MSRNCMFDATHNKLFMATPDWHHHWCQRDRHRCQIMHVLPIRQCAGNEIERKEEKIPLSLPFSKESLHTLHRLIRRAPRVWCAHVPDIDCPSPSYQVGMPTFTSAQLCPHSHEYVHSQRHSPLSPRVARPILHGDSFFILLWIWSRNQSP